MKHLHLVSRKPALAQFNKQTTKEIKGEFFVDLFDRLARTAQSLPWGVKFPTD